MRYCACWRRDRSSPETIRPVQRSGGIAGNLWRVISGETSIHARSANPSAINEARALLSIRPADQNFANGASNLYLAPGAKVIANGAM
jgi:hypothetical protein